ncbi:Metallo-hydrolase/oxidoreductase [Trichodelitschia bisporula]|uniref:Metallo-hydrolase/oxidoreductase n=1 Tax=Trichodelitschia bisporula TaxID=703511 RepID=A0A6G1I8J8_9PEZI|nr:Metallo-hydrolase/oxidoreductase [Trichodelitschia bisporula]
MAPTNPPLPAASPSQPTINLRRLPAGDIHLRAWLFVSGAPKNEINVCPSMSWLITHPPSGTRLIFDLGIPKDPTCYTPAIQKRITTVAKVEVREDVFDGLQRAGLDPATDIDTVIFSHLHYDHIGFPRGFGPRTKYVVGPGALGLITGPASYPADPNSHFDSNLLPRERTTELPPGTDGSFWSPLGPFPAARDWFGDGSVYVVNAPGHLPGHVNLLVRVEREKWVLLGGDSCHDVRILCGQCETSVYRDPETGVIRNAHIDKELAEEHLGRIRKLADEVEVVLAHDWEWARDNPTKYGYLGTVEGKARI